MKTTNTLLAAAAMMFALTTQAQGPTQNEELQMTENWVTAIDQVMESDATNEYVFDLSADAEAIYTSETEMVLITESDLEGSEQYTEELESGIFESGNTYFTPCGEVQNLGTNGYTICYMGEIEGEQVMMQRYFYTDGEGTTYEAKVLSKELSPVANDLSAASVLIVGLMDAQCTELALGK